jgi:hypothetical protein
MKRINDDIRMKIRAAGLYQWQVAMACGISEFTLVRWLRGSLTEEQRKAIYTAIEAFTASKEEE